MSHTSDYDEDGVMFTHNGDYSGYVTVTVPAATAEWTLEHNSKTCNMRVPYAAIEKFVLDKLRREKIDQLENAEYEELKQELLR